MQKKQIIKLLRKAGYEETHGGKHDIFIKKGRPPITVPRHTEIAKGTAIKILKMAGIAVEK